MGGRVWAPSRMAAAPSWQQGSRLCHLCRHLCRQGTCARASAHGRTTHTHARECRVHANAWQWTSSARTRILLQSDCVRACALQAQLTLALPPSLSAAIASSLAPLLSPLLSPLRPSDRHPPLHPSAHALLVALPVAGALARPLARFFSPALPPAIAHPRSSPLLAEIGRAAG